MFKGAGGRSEAEQAIKKLAIFCSRKQQQQRKKEYQQEIREMHRRVKGRPLLLEQVAQVSSSQTLMFFGLHRNSAYSLQFSHSL